MLNSKYQCYEKDCRGSKTKSHEAGQESSDQSSDKSEDDDDYDKLVTMASPISLGNY